MVGGIRIEIVEKTLNKYESNILSYYNFIFKGSAIQKENIVPGFIEYFNYLSISSN